MLDQAIAFEAKLAETAYTSADRMSPDYTSRINNMMTKEEVQELSPVFPLLRLVERFGFGDADEFMITNPEQAKRLNELYTEENLEAIKATMIISYLNSMASMLDEESYAVDVESVNIVNGSSGRRPDQSVAFDKVRKNLSSPMGQAYLARYDTQRQKRK